MVTESTPPPSSFRAYAELARLSNIPTVVTNGLLGFAIAVASSTEPLDVWPLLVVIPAIMLFYIGGMALNDVVDTAIDRKERPGRPIPSGRVSRVEAGVFAAGCLLLGLGMLVPSGLAATFFAVALVLTIVAYDVVHKMTAFSGVLMGACRGLVYLTVASAFAWPLDWRIAGVLAVAMTAYIGVVTFIARSEAAKDSRAATLVMRRFAIVLPGIAVVPILWVVPSRWDAAIGAGLVLLGWLVFTQRHLLVPRPRMKQAILSYLAGICLIDMFYLTLLEQNALAVIAAACFAITLLAHRSISGT